MRSKAQNQKIWRECGKWATQYVNKKFPHLVKQAKQEKAEIKALWATFSDKQKKALNQIKGHYIS